jgi:hypothetical protein
MSLNQFNRWVQILYNEGFNRGTEVAQEETVAAIREFDLYELILSVKGIGEKRAIALMKKIVREDWEVDDFEGNA